jgi:hypothetical protein
MPKTNTEKPQEVLYAVVGVGDFAIEKVRDLPVIASSKARTKIYKDFVKRGRSLSTRIQNSAPTKQAIEQTKTARSQVKAAATSVGKAMRANASGSSKKAAEQTKVARSQVKAASTSVRKAASAGAKATRAAAGKAVQAS